MPVTDPVADMLTRIRNALGAKHESVNMPASKMKKAVAGILLKEGFIKADDDILLISGSLLAPKAKTCNISLYNVKNIEGLGI